MGSMILPIGTLMYMYINLNLCRMLVSGEQNHEETIYKLWKKITSGGNVYKENTETGGIELPYPEAPN